jgi:predicted dehydrogenase
MTSRRVFLQASAAIATASHPILGANDKAQIGIVGLGGRGTDHIEYYSAIPDARIAAICDVNQAARERAAARIKKAGGGTPTEFADMRKLFESKEVDAVSVPLPNHWHALATIWACQAGKDVYVEKPASHNMFESVKMVEAARKYKRMVQVGSQSRSVPHKMKAIAMLREGAIGKVFGARALCFRRRFSIGHTPDEPVPPGVDWDKFLGPAQLKPYSKNKFDYNWHWFWDTGNGDIGNQGVHEMDIALWGLGRNDWPKRVMSGGGKYIWQDDQETPNTQQASFTWDDGEMTFDVRNLPTPPEGLVAMRGPNYVGDIFFGDLGFMVLDQQGYQVFKSAAGNFVGARGAGAGSREKYEKVSEGKIAAAGDDETIPHMKNFIQAVKSRDHTKLNAEIEIGARSAAFCHLANIAYRAGRPLKLDAQGRFLADDEANAMQTRKYRAPYIVPDKV